MYVSRITGLGHRLPPLSAKATESSTTWDWRWWATNVRRSTGVAFFFRLPITSSVPIQRCAIKHPGPTRNTQVSAAYNITRVTLECITSLHARLTGSLVPGLYE